MFENNLKKSKQFTMGSEFKLCALNSDYAVVLFEFEMLLISHFRDHIQFIIPAFTRLKI